MNNRIKEVRKVLKLTQSDFGEKIGVASNTVTNYETGRREPTNSVILAICREFNVNENWLRTGEGKMFIERDRVTELVEWAGKLSSPINDGSFKQRFVHMLSRLDEDGWKVLENMALLMADEIKKD